MSASHRFHLRLPWELDAEIRNFAHQHGLGVSSAIRLLVGRGLQTEALGSSAAHALMDSAPTLAALTAAEHAVLMVASVLPEGERRMHLLGERAAQAAEERLALFRTPQEEP